MNRRQAMIGTVGATALLFGANRLTSADTADNVNVFERYIDEVVNQGNLDVINEVIHEDYQPSADEPSDQPGRDAFRQRAADALATRQANFSAWEFVIKQTIGEGDWIAAMCRFTGTELDGSVFDTPAFYFVEIVDGMIHQLPGVIDVSLFLEQTS